MSEMLQLMGAGLVYVLMGLTCLFAIAISALTLSGTWIVAGVTLFAAWYRGEAFPGWITVAAFLLVSLAIEVVEFFASSWGITRRGGSKLAGAAALVRGLVGMFLGGLIPIPILGPILGMLAGSFGLAFLVEWQRLKSHSGAAQIAWGAVMARLFVALLKMTGAMVMTLVLFLGMALG